MEFGSKIAEEVGFEKVSKQVSELKQLQYVLLDGMRIDRAEEDRGEMEDTCPSLFHRIPDRS